MKALIVGGSSGLGLELAKQLKNTHEVVITGRKDPGVAGLNFILLEIKQENLNRDIEQMVKQIGEIDLLVYAAGFYQEGTISELSENDILQMNAVGLLAPAFFLHQVLKIQGSLNGFISITSTSQWTPRLKEPMYNAVKGGLGMLTNSVALDPRVHKTLLAGPAGMKTNFWAKTEMDMSGYMDPIWVAEQIINLWGGNYKYKYARILRQPPRVEVIEER